jgi:hypothetical protein
MTLSDEIKQLVFLNKEPIYVFAAFLPPEKTNVIIKPSNLMSP